MKAITLLTVLTLLAAVACDSRPSDEPTRREACASFAISGCTGWASCEGEDLMPCVDGIMGICCENNGTCEEPSGVDPYLMEECRIDALHAGCPWLIPVSCSDLRYELGLLP